jgi:hypothetical protein
MQDESAAKTLRAWSSILQVVNTCPEAKQVELIETFISLLEEQHRHAKERLTTHGK